MNIEQLKREMPKTVKVTDAAEIMGIHPTTLREGLKQSLFPFGVAIKMTQTESYINTRRFIAYMEAEDLKGGFRISPTIIHIPTEEQKE